MYLQFVTVVFIADSTFQSVSNCLDEVASVNQGENTFNASSFQGMSYKLRLVISTWYD